MESANAAGTATTCAEQHGRDRGTCEERLAEPPTVCRAHQDEDEEDREEAGWRFRIRRDRRRPAQVTHVQYGAERSRVASKRDHDGCRQPVDHERAQEPCGHAAACVDGDGGIDDEHVDGEGAQAEPGQCQHPLELGPTEIGGVKDLLGHIVLRPHITCQRTTLARKASSGSAIPCSARLQAGLAWV